MCGEPNRGWVEFSAEQMREIYDWHKDDREFRRWFDTGLPVVTPHGYPRDKSIGHFILELKAAQEERDR